MLGIFCQRCLLIVLGVSVGLPQVLANGLSVEVFNQNGKPLHNAVVFVESHALIASMKPLENAEVAQQNKQFIPQVSVVTRGTAVEFPNRDTVRHHVYSFSAAKTFELKLYIDKPKAPVVFDKTGIVDLGCNIHDEMLAWVLVTDTPVYAATNQVGVANFERLVADNYTVRAWHPEIKYGVSMPVKTLDFNNSETTIRLVIETY